MADLLSLFKERADEFLAAINQKGGVRATIAGLRRQMAEADRRRAIGRVKAELQRLDRQINEMITAVGVQAVALQEAGQLSSPELGPLCQHIIDLKAALGQQQAELAALEAIVESSAAVQTRPCVRCGQLVPTGGTFCPYCGAPLSAPAAAASAGAMPTLPSAKAPNAASAEPQAMAASPSQTEPALLAATTVAQVTCARCGAPLKPGAKFCSRCGRAV